MNLPDAAYLLALLTVLGWRPSLVRQLVDAAGSARAVWEENVLDSLIIPDLREVLRDTRRRVDPEREWILTNEAGIKIITFKDLNFPLSLKNISDPPLLLYVKGEVLERDQFALAVVGARRATGYGLSVAENISYEVAVNKITIVSGLALGIDSAAHRGALKADGGRTIAVLGSGLDIIYPRSNLKLAREIEERGALISEFPLGTRPLAGNFPRRNRLISGLARGVLVVEAAEKSGSLITADFALEQGRDVFAVPGNITGIMSRGTNNLIAQGAKLVQKAEDILEEFGTSDRRVPRPTTELTEEEKKILALLKREPLHIDQIVAGGWPLPAAALILKTMELKGLVKELPGKIFMPVFGNTSD